MIKIMFVCTGNICRSAMAEYLLKQKLIDKGMAQKVEVSSCGTYAETNESSTYEAITTMKKVYGIDMQMHRATRLRDSKIYEMDLILCMTNSHKNTLLMTCPDLDKKIFLLKEYVGLEGDVDDPYGYALDVYNKCAEEINNCLDLLVEKEFGGV